MSSQESVEKMVQAIHIALPVLTKEQKEAFAKGFLLSAAGANVSFSGNIAVGSVSSPEHLVLEREKSYGK